jgi:hypothetical protein
MNTANTSAMGHEVPGSQRTSTLRHRGRDDALYRTAFAVSFPLFLVGVAVTRLFTAGPSHQGLMAEALDSAHSSIAIALKD